jgi:sulfate transport system permease protein
VILPGLRRRCSPALRWPSPAAVGEYGSVIFIAGNMPMSRDRAAADRHQARGVRLCRRHRDRRDHAGDLFAMLLVINLIQAWSRRRFGDV